MFFIIEKEQNIAVPFFGKMEQVKWLNIRKAHSIFGKKMSISPKYGAWPISKKMNIRIFHP